MSEPRRSRHRVIEVAFGVSALGSLGLALVYLRGGQPQLEGLLLFVALGGIAAGSILWAHHLMPKGPYVEPRPPLGRRDEEEEAERSFEESADAIGRRRFIVRMLGVAAGALGLAALFPIRSLGTRPGRDLFHTEWSEGAALIDESGAPVTASAFDVGSFLTVFPEGHVGSADSQAVLIRIDPADYDPEPGREDWAPEGFIAFSKVCTHAGCPVGLYQPTEHQLFCPCHQSAFAVLRGAAPIAGPATRPLPQLPLDIDTSGRLVARGDFPEPIGPGFWNRGTDA